ncbi:hypothetical protein EPI10_030296 [Gossypium australe]|uniref:CCHC-type domain-containing protein n=1 Tax=Gossypium australe TaxID=47621 RepID=A0A5B6X0I6_9ROSI|nr:hypothetical protein EPI10_030296 [Gossypium australe]
MIGKVAKLDFNTDNGSRGSKQVIQQIEYKYLPTVCLLCGHYGHMKEICPRGAIGPEESGEGILRNREEQGQNIGLNTEEAPPNLGTYDASREEGRDNGETQAGTVDISRFQVLENLIGEGSSKDPAVEVDLGRGSFRTCSVKPRKG